MRDYYFYTDPSKLQPQTKDQAFGQFATPGFDNYRTTSLHTVNGATTVPAIAVCSGTICIQPNGNTFNIILKPDYQPSFNFPYIQYFIYKGIKKESLVSLNEIIVNDSIPFIKRFHENWEDEKQEEDGTVVPNPKTNSADVLGLYYQPESLVSGEENRYYDVEPSIFNDNNAIDNFFYYSGLDPAFALPIVKAGEKIGDFISNFGFEIIVERFGYEAKIQWSRNFENIIKVGKITDQLNEDDTWSVTDKTYFTHWLDKEVSLNFIDACAFFGSFGNENLYYKKNGTVKTMLPDYNALYEIIIKPVFRNKNRLYIRITDSHLNSYLLWKTSKKINVTNAFLSEDSQLWPDMVIEMGEPALPPPDHLAGDYTYYNLDLPALQEENLIVLQGFFATRQNRIGRYTIENYEVIDGVVSVKLHSGIENVMNCSAFVELCLEESNEILSDRDKSWKLYRYLNISSLKYRHNILDAVSGSTSDFGMFPFAQPFLSVVNTESVVSQMAYIVGDKDVYVVTYPLERKGKTITPLVPMAKVMADEDTLTYFLHRTSIKSYRIRIKEIKYTDATETKKKDINIIGKDFPFDTNSYHELYNIIGIDRDRYLNNGNSSAIGQFIKIALKKSEKEFNEYTISSVDIKKTSIGEIQKSDGSINIRAFEAK